MTAIDGDGAVLCPGLVDMRAEVGEPGGALRETVPSAARAAAAGGITTLAALPDTQPAVDEPALVRLLRARGEETGSLTILPYAAATGGCAGLALAEYGLLREAGAIALHRRCPGHRLVAADARRPAVCARLRRDDRAASRGSRPGRRRCRDRGRARHPHGLPGIPAEAEAILVARDIALARLTGGAVHFAQSRPRRRCARSGAQGRRAAGDLRYRAAVFRSERDGDRRLSHLRQALAAAARRGGSRRRRGRPGRCCIDAVASDHQPRDADDKRLPFAQAAAGGAGLSTLLGITLAQVHAGALPLLRALELLTARPARLLGSDAGTLARGAAADLTLFDLDRAWRVEAGKLPGRPQNTPFDGRALEGRVRGTWKAGRRVYDAD